MKTLFHSMAVPGPVIRPQAPLPSPSIPAKSKSLQCVFCPRDADLLHKGSSYCRACYDEKNRTGRLIG